jgi:hypothetical protein
VKLYDFGILLVIAVVAAVTAAVVLNGLVN